ncbi:MAG: hypothetical protein JSW07_00300 [bacterium]|nr:MAG: hypothetical protein JSW07_00300 [bacterium]
MSEFEKWWDRTLCSNNKNLKVIAKITWKAALEWVLSRVDFANSDGSIIYDIKQELKQLNQSNSQSDNSSQSDSPS